MALATEEILDLDTEQAAYLALLVTEAGAAFDGGEPGQEEVRARIEDVCTKRGQTPVRVTFVRAFSNTCGVVVSTPTETVVALRGTRTFLEWLLDVLVLDRLSLYLRIQVDTKAAPFRWMGGALSWSSSRLDVAGIRAWLLDTVRGAQRAATMGLPRRPKAKPARQHFGFEQYALQVLPQVESALRAALEMGSDVFLAGHSLGGAAAVILAELLVDRVGSSSGQQIQVYTFGAPPTSSVPTGARVRIRQFRLPEDLVPRVVPELQGLGIGPVRVHSDLVGSYHLGDGYLLVRDRTTRSYRVRRDDHAWAPRFWIPPALRLAQNAAWRRTRLLKRILARHEMVRYLRVLDRLNASRRAPPGCC